MDEREEWYTSAKNNNYVSKETQMAFQMLTSPDDIFIVDMVESIRYTMRRGEDEKKTGNGGLLAHFNDKEERPLEDAARPEMTLVNQHQWRETAER